LLDRLDVILRRALKKFRARIVITWLQTPPAYRFAVLDALWSETLDEIIDALAHCLANGWNVARDALAEILPPHVAEKVAEKIGLVQREETLSEAMLPPQIQISYDLPRGRIFRGRPFKRPRKARQWKQLVAQFVFPPLKPKELRDTWTKPGVLQTDTLKKRLSSRLWSDSDKAVIQSQLTTGLAKGETVDELTNRLSSALDAIDWKARRIARTEARRALERDNFERTNEVLGDIIVAYRIQAVLDDRTRPAHRKRDGRIYRRQSDGSYRSKRGELLPELPDAPNCRCMAVPIFSDK
jgi:SPP1 gp7 family putative phage head morphogenesis protein